MTASRDGSPGALPPGGGPGTAALARALVGALTRRGQTLAVAESLTGGALTAAVVDVPGASAVLRGGVVAYATDLKGALLGVEPDLLERVGAVHAVVGQQMAAGARVRLGADWALATTGVAGPEPLDGRPPGTVVVAVCGPGVDRVQELRLPGDRAAVRASAVRAALDALAEALGVDAPDVAEQGRAAGG